MITSLMIDTADNVVVIIGIVIVVVVIVVIIVVTVINFFAEMLLSRDTPLVHQVGLFETRCSQQQLRSCFQQFAF